MNSQSIVKEPIHMNGASLPFYYEVGQEVEVCEVAHASKLPVLLKGPTGTGKSRLVEYVAAKLKLELVTILCHEETSAVDLIGRHLIVGGETQWCDGPLTRAVRSGAIVYLDEVAEARPDVLVAIHSLTDHRRELYIDRINEHVKAPESFMLMASYNPGYQRALKEMKSSTRQRFVSLNLQYPNAAVETTILMKETGISKQVARSLAELAERIRNLSELGLAESVSTRLLVDAAKLMQAGLAPRLACSVAISEPLTDDADTVVALNNLINMKF